MTSIPILNNRFSFHCMESVGLPSKIYTASIVINSADRNLLTLATSKGDMDFRALGYFNILFSSFCMVILATR